MSTKIIGMEKTARRSYEIGGIHVHMTPAAAARWNAGETTRHDLRTCRVFLPAPGNDYTEMTLDRATSYRLSPETAKRMDGMPARAYGVTY